MDKDSIHACRTTSLALAHHIQLFSSLLSSDLQQLQSHPHIWTSYHLAEASLGFKGEDSKVGADDVIPLMSSSPSHFTYSWAIAILFVHIF